MKKVVLATVALVGFAFADAPASYATCKACHGVKGETQYHYSKQISCSS